MAVWNYENAAHLLRRAGFGGTPTEIQAFLDQYDSVEDAVDALVDFGVSNKKPPSGGRDQYQGERKQKQWWIKTMMKTRSPGDALREKMTLFWHNHLCSGLDKVRELAYQERGTALMAIQNGLFRSHANGNFKDLLLSFNRDGANLYYLDGRFNYASQNNFDVTANENFGREVLELFTVGINQLAADGTDDPSKPNYTEDDVHQLARACTGWVGTVEKGIGTWEAWAWDNGRFNDGGGTAYPGDPIVIFGVQNNNYRIHHDVVGTPDDILQVILDREDDEGNKQAAMYLCRKLWKWFAYSPPAPGFKLLIAEFANILVTSNYELKPVLAAMFKHDEFYGAAAKTRAIKNPVEYMVGMVRSLGLKNSGKPIGDSGELYDMLDEMGMELFEPPNVAGWPGGKRWITTGTLVNRLELARRIAESNYGQSNLHLGTIVPIGSATTDPAVVVDAILYQLGLDDVGSGLASQGGTAFTAAQRAAVLDFITDGGMKTTLDLSNEFTDDAEDYVRGALALVLQSAENQVF